jgi:hypothetical protein
MSIPDSTLPFTSTLPFIPDGTINSFPDRVPWITPNQSPRTLPVMMPFSSFGVTIAILDSDGNLTIKVDQPKPESGT